MSHARYRNRLTDAIAVLLSGDPERDTRVCIRVNDTGERCWLASSDFRARWKRMGVPAVHNGR